MGVLLALMVFVYRLALPVVTLGALIFVAASLRLGVLVAAARAVVAFPLLVVFLTPGVVSTVAGSFLLPWWLHVAVGHSGVHYYPVEYALVCVGAFFFLILFRVA